MLEHWRVEGAGPGISSGKRGELEMLWASGGLDLVLQPESMLSGGD